MAKLSKAVVRRRSKSILTPRQRPQSCEIAAAQRLSAEVLDARSAACDLENKRSQLDLALFEVVQKDAIRPAR
jgi:hypothetical protein